MQWSSFSVFLYFWKIWETFVHSHFIWRLFIFPDNITSLIPFNCFLTSGLAPEERWYVDTSSGIISFRQKYLKESIEPVHFLLFWWPSFILLSSLHPQHHHLLQTRPFLQSSHYHYNLSRKKEMHTPSFTRNIFLFWRNFYYFTFLTDAVFHDFGDYLVSWLNCLMVPYPLALVLY